MESTWDFMRSGYFFILVKKEEKQMKVLEIISPVLVMIILGILCRKWKLLNKNGIDNMKALVTNIMTSGSNFSCTGDIRLWSRNGETGRDHVYHACGIFQHRISYETAHDRKLPQVSAIYGQCV